MPCEVIEEIVEKNEFSTIHKQNKVAFISQSDLKQDSVIGLHIEQDICSRTHWLIPGGGMYKMVKYENEHTQRHTLK